MNCFVASVLVSLPAVAGAQEEIDSEDFNVPEHLRVLPTDTEAEKKRKKKAIKALKNSHRIFTCAGSIAFAAAGR